MNYSQMKPGIIYKVNTGNSTFKKGDSIKLGKDGSILCQQANGWIPKDDAKESMTGVEFDIDIDRYEQAYRIALKNLKHDIKMIRKEYEDSIKKGS